MAEDDVTIGVRTTGTEEAAQEVRNVAASLVGLTEAQKALVAQIRGEFAAASQSQISAEQEQASALQKTTAAAEQAAEATRQQAQAEEASLNALIQTREAARVASVNQAQAEFEAMTAEDKLAVQYNTTGDAIRMQQAAEEGHLSTLEKVKAETLAAADAAARRAASEQSLAESSARIAAKNTEQADSTSQLTEQYKSLGSAGMLLVKMFGEVAQAKTLEDKHAVVAQAIDDMTILSNQYDTATKKLGATTTGTDKWAQALEIARNAMRGMNDEVANTSVAATQIAKVTTGFAEVDSSVEGARKAIERFDTKWTTGARLWQRDVDLIAQQYRRLQLAVKEVHDQQGDLPPAVIQAQTQIRAELTRTVDKMREVKDAQMETNRRLAEGGYQFSSLGVAMRDAAGAAGPLVAQTIAVGAALTYGWDKGMQFNRMIGVNLSAWDQWVEESKSGARSFIEDFTNIGTSMLIVRDRLKEWDLKGALNEIKTFGDMSVKSFKSLDDSIKVTDNEMKGFDDVVRAGISTRNALAASASDLTKIHMLHTLALAGGTEGLKIWNDAVEKSHGSVNLLIKSLDLEKEALERAGEAALKASEKHHTLAEKIKEVLGRNEEWIDAMNKSNKLAQDQDKVVGGLTKTMRDELGEISQFISMGPAYRGQVAIWGEALEKTAKAQDGLTEEQKKNLIALGELAKTYATANELERIDIKSQIDLALATKATQASTEAITVTMVNGHAVITNTVKATGELAGKQIEVKNAAGEVVTHLGHSNDKMKEVPAAAQAAGTGLSEFATHLHTTVTSCNTLKDKLDEIIKTMKVVGITASTMGKTIDNAAKAGTKEYDANQVVGGEEIPDSGPGGSNVTSVYTPPPAPPPPKNTLGMGT